jgi:hypothetical protein
MANEIRQKFDAWDTSPAITLASLGIGAAQSSAAVTNPNARGRAKILLSTRTNAAPTANTLIELFLLEQDDSAAITGRTDDWTAADAAFTVTNAKNLGSLVVTATSNTVSVVDVFETTFVATLNGNGWGIAVRNGTNQILHATAGNHIVRRQYFLDEIQ